MNAESVMGGLRLFDRHKITSACVVFICIYMYV